MPACEMEVFCRLLPMACVRGQRTSAARALPDVQRLCCPLRLSADLCDRHETVCEEREEYPVWLVHVGEVCSGDETTAGSCLPTSRDHAYDRQQAAGRRAGRHSPRPPFDPINQSIIIRHASSSCTGRLTAARPRLGVDCDGQPCSQRAVTLQSAPGGELRQARQCVRMHRTDTGSVFLVALHSALVRSRSLSLSLSCPASPRRANRLPQR